MLRWKVMFPLLFFLIFSFDEMSAALTLPAGPPQVAIDWSGINEVDGDGSAGFSSRGETVNAVLKVLCNVRRGYNITFYSQNAHKAIKSRLISGSNRIVYTATLITTGIKNANIVKSSLNLNNVGVTSVEVNFWGGVLPLNGSTEANRIKLSLKLSNYGQTIKLKPMGLYTDTITATAALN